MINTNILDKKARIAIVATGGGAGAQNELWKIPGISSILVDAEFPYDQDYTIEYLGYTPNGSFASEEVAINLAMKAFYKAYKYDGAPAIGIGLTASVASLRPHKGEHRIYAASFSDKGCKLIYIKLSKGQGPEDRVLDGKICDKVILNLILDELDLSKDKYPFDSTCVVEIKEIPDALSKAEAEFFKRPFFTKEGERHCNITTFNKAIFPGSFNPPHSGHLSMAKSCYNKKYYTKNSVTGDKIENNIDSVIFLIEQESPHKGVLSVVDLLKRAKLLQRYDVFFTKGLSLYLDKARAFCDCPIILGVDSLIRLLDPKWGVDIESLCTEFHSLNTNFLVFDRVIDGKLVTVNDIHVYDLNVTRINGQWDISSTEIRKKLGQNNRV